MPFRRCARTKPADASPVCEWGFRAHSRAHRCGGGGGGGGGSRWDWDAQPWLGGGGTRRLVVLKGFVRRGKPEGGVRGLVSANFAISVLVSGRCISPSLQSLLVCTLFMLVCMHAIHAGVRAIHAGVHAIRASMHAIRAGMYAIRAGVHAIHAGALRHKTRQTRAFVRLKPDARVCVRLSWFG
jgi:hypothetical protein